MKIPIRDKTYLAVQIKEIEREQAYAHFDVLHLDVLAFAPREFLEGEKLRGVLVYSHRLSIEDESLRALLDTLYNAIKSDLHVPRPLIIPPCIASSAWQGEWGAAREEHTRGNCSMRSGYFLLMSSELRLNTAMVPSLSLCTCESSE